MHTGEKMDETNESRDISNIVKTTFVRVVGIGMIAALALAGMKCYEHHNDRYDHVSRQGYFMQNPYIHK